MPSSLLSRNNHSVDDHFKLEEVPDLGSCICSYRNLVGPATFLTAFKDNATSYYPSADLLTAQMNKSSSTQILGRGVPEGCSLNGTEKYCAGLQFLGVDKLPHADCFYSGSIRYLPTIVTRTNSTSESESMPQNTFSIPLQQQRTFCDKAHKRRNL